MIKKGEIKWLWGFRLSLLGKWWTSEQKKKERGREEGRKEGRKGKKQKDRQLAGVLSGRILKE